MENENNIEEQEFEAMMDQRIRNNFLRDSDGGIEISDDRLKEMNKKLPEWSLEPPYTFLK